MIAYVLKGHSIFREKKKNGKLICDGGCVFFFGGVGTMKLTLSFFFFCLFYSFERKKSTRIKIKGGGRLSKELKDL